MSPWLIHLAVLRKLPDGDTRKTYPRRSSSLYEKKNKEKGCYQGRGLKTGISTNISDDLNASGWNGYNNIK